MVAGELIAETVDVDYTVVGGESVSFDGRLAHRYRNESHKRTGMILSVTPPNPSAALTRDSELSGRGQVPRRSQSARNVRSTQLPVLSKMRANN